MFGVVDLLSAVVVIVGVPATVCVIAVTQLKFQKWAEAWAQKHPCEDEKHP